MESIDSPLVVSAPITDHEKKTDTDTDDNTSDIIVNKKTKSDMEEDETEDVSSLYFEFTEKHEEDIKKISGMHNSPYNIKDRNVLLGKKTPTITGGFDDTEFVDDDNYLVGHSAYFEMY